MDISFAFNLPTKIVFGNGTAQQIGAEASTFGKKALVVTGHSSTKESGTLDIVLASLDANHVKARVFNDIDPNPDVESVRKGADALKKFGADCIVAVGGGSPIDAAKAIGVVATEGGDIRKYFGIDKMKKKIMPLIAVPTTSGTGSEVTRYAAISDRKEGTKNLVAGMKICPSVAVVDPQLTLSMPKDLAAVTGIDALSHAIESLVCTFSQPMTDLLNLEAARCIGEFLPISVQRQRDRDAHEQMAYASLLAGITINNAGTGIAHGMSYALTSQYGVPHGVAVGLLLPYVMEFNLPAAYRKYAALAEALGEEVCDMPPHEAAYCAVEAVKRLLRDVGFPESLTVFGVEDERIEEFAAEMMTLKDKLANNPRMPEHDDLVEIFVRARDEGIV
jgi:alcohol dehydrogenase class IV